jgi:hypothetical protein
MNLDFYPEGSRSLNRVTDPTIGLPDCKSERAELQIAKGRVSYGAFSRCGLFDRQQFT